MTGKQRRARNAVLAFGPSMVQRITACEAVLAQMHKLRPDVVLTDVMMPHMDGVALCTRLRRDPGMSHLAIVGMSAVRQAVAGIGFTAFLAKPVELDQVLRCVHEALSHV